MCGLEETRSVNERVFQFKEAGLLSVVLVKTLTRPWVVTTQSPDGLST